MKKHNPKRIQPGDSDDGPQALAALRTATWMIPQTPDEVKAAEAQLALATDPIALPDALHDPQAVWARGTDGMAIRLPLPPALPQIEAMLARAAREGGRLTPEIEDRMRQDRQAAEDQSDKDHAP